MLLSALVRKQKRFRKDYKKLGKIQKLGVKLVWILKFRQWFCRPSFETALAPEEIPWRIGGNSSPLFPLVVFILPSDDQKGLNERGEGKALAPLRRMVKDYPQSFIGRNLVKLLIQTPDKLPINFR